MSAAEKLAPKLRSRSAYWLSRTGASQHEIAIVAKCSQPAVKKWFDGTSIPSDERQIWLEARWPRVTAGEGWQLPYVEGDVPDLEPPARKAPPLASIPDLDAPPKPPPPPARDIPDTFEGRLEEYERQLREDLAALMTTTDGTPLERARLRGELLRQSKLVAEMKGELDVSKRILKLPEFVRAVKTIAEAVKGYPDAAVAIAKALRSLENP